MKRALWKRAAAGVLLLPMLAMFLTGCWDNKELDELFIMTGVAMDVADDPDQISVTVQVANIQRGESGSAESGPSDGDSTIVLNAEGDSLLNCISQMNRDSNHKLIFQHNQIRLFGIELAQQGIKKHLDMIMRDQKARLEVPLAVVDGRAEAALTAELSQSPISGIFLGELFEDLSDMSVKYRVRLIDFVQQLLDGAAAPVLPIIKVTGGSDKPEIKLDGMAVFHDDKMIGRLSNEETLGYIWSFGGVERSNIEVWDGTSRAGLYVAKLDCKREVTLRPDGGVRVTITVNSVVGAAEVYGFADMTPPELLQHLEYLAQEEIKNRITECYMVARSMNADIFGFGTMVYKQYPKQWNEMKERWNEVFADIELNVEATVNIPGTGQIVQSLEMEENMK